MPFSKDKQHEHALGRTVRAGEEPSTQARPQPWKLSIRARSRPDSPYLEFSVVGSNGVASVLLHGGRVSRLENHAKERGELAAAQVALKWLSHAAPRSHAQVLLGPEAYCLLDDEATCPAALVAERELLLRRSGEAPNVLFLSACRSRLKRPAGGVFLVTC